MNIVKRMQFRLFHVWLYKSRDDRICHVCGQKQAKGGFDTKLFGFRLVELGDLEAHSKIKICT